MLLMNTMQRLDGNPYPDCQALLVLGFNNMPFPTACTLLQYAAKNHPNTFLTGMPSETIYDFAMAYPNMMNGISAFAGDGIDIIHLNEKTKLNDDIKALLELNPSWKFNPERIQCQCFNGPLDQFSILDVVNKAMEFGPGQIIIAPSKTYLEPLTERIKTQRDIIRDPSHEHFYIENISANAPSDIRYGRYIAELCERFYKDLNLVEIEPENLFYQTYNQLAFENNTARENLGREAYENDRTCKHRKKLMENISKFYDEFTKYKRQKTNPFDWGKTKLEAEPVLSLVYDIICFEINKFNVELEKNIVNPDINIRDVLHKDGILLSTIHASVDLRATKCIAIIDKQSYKKDFDAIMHVALSRNSEKLCVYIFNASTPDASNPYISILTNISRGETH